MTAPVRVLVDLSVAPPGGAGSYAAGFARGLVRASVPDRDHVVVVVDSSWAGEHRAEVDALRTAGVTVDPVELAPPGTWKARFGRGRVLRRAAAFHAAQVAYFPRDATPRMPIPVVLLVNNLYAWHRFHSTAAIGGPVAAALLRRAAWRSARRAAAILAVSAPMAAALPEDVEVKAIVHHGCAMEEFDRGSEPAGGAPIALMVGNVIANKGFEVAIDAVALARRDGRAWELRVHGNRRDAAYAARLDDQARAWLGASVLLGPAYGADLVDAYRAAQVLVMGGTFESFCFPLVEAMRSGCVVVAPACPLVEEICGDVALTYIEGDARSLARTLEQAWEQRNDRSHRGVERARSFTWEEAVQQTISLVRSVVAQP